MRFGYVKCIRDTLSIYDSGKINFQTLGKDTQNCRVLHGIAAHHNIFTDHGVSFDSEIYDVASYDSDSRLFNDPDARKYVKYERECREQSRAEFEARKQTRECFELCVSGDPCHHC